MSTELRIRFNKREINADTKKRMGEKKRNEEDKNMLNENKTKHKN